MKIFSVVLMLTLITFGVSSQIPEKMSYQCVVRNISGLLLTNQIVGIRISILQGTSSGEVLFQETFNPNPVTNANGLVILEIGGGTPVTGSFSNINWASGPYFLKTEIDPVGGTNYTIIGVSQLLSVPYALYSESSNETDPIFASNGVKISGDQSIAGNKVFTGTTTVATPVNATDAANKAYVDRLKEVIYNELLAAGLNGIVTDIVGNVYKTIKIGNQVWMAENLKTSKYNDGSPIPKVTDNDAWANLGELVNPGEINEDLVVSGAYCWYNNDSATYENDYGKLYNFGVAKSGKLCPAGWRVPTRADWEILYYPNRLGFISGAQLMETGTIHWRSPDIVGTNETGFTALPGGYRREGLGFSGITIQGNYWSSTDGGGYYYSAYCYPIPIPEGFGHSPSSMFSSKKIGASIRCIKD